MSEQPWDIIKIREIYHQPFLDLILKAQAILRQNFEKNTIKLSTLLNIKSGGCRENCSYCSQSIHYNSDIKPNSMIDSEQILDSARKAKENGATRFCLAAAWRGPSDSQLEKICALIGEIKSMGLETCVSLGLLKPEQAKKLKAAKLDYYNHNLNTSEKHYPNIATTHSFQDRLDTVNAVTTHGIHACSGGILGMNESIEDRLSMLQSLANLPTPPKSMPINILQPMPNTPLEHASKLDLIEFFRYIATARIVLPKAFIRLSCGRTRLSAGEQALAFLAGINSIHFGSEYLLTKYTPLPKADEDLNFLASLGLTSNFE